MQAYLLYIPITSRTIKKTSFGVLIHQVLLQVPIAAVKRPPHFFQQPILLIFMVQPDDFAVGDRDDAIAFCRSGVFLNHFI